MQPILTFDDLAKLQPKDKFYVIKFGRCNAYIYNGISPVSDKIVVATSSANYLTAVCFSDSDLRQKSVFLSGKYDSKTVGEIMIQQLEDEIEGVKKVYLK